MINEIINVMVRIFILLTPFFVLSMFIATASEMDSRRQRSAALKTTAAILVICILIYFFGEYVFAYMGITIDAFRIGAGIILLISAVDLVLGKNKGGQLDSGAANNEEQGFAIVPMAIPYAIGPGTIGALLVMGGDAGSLGGKLIDCCGISLAVIAVGIILLLADIIQRLIGTRGIQVLSKITGLVLAGLAAQVIFTGIKNFLFQS